MQKVYIEKVLTYEELLETWDILGRQYSTPLQVKLDDFSGYMKKLFDFADNYIVKSEKQLAGAISFYCNNRETGVAFISQICTSELFRGRGIGTLLLNQCEKDAKKSQMKIIRLEVKKENSVAISFYEKNGFVKVEDSEKSYYMEKKIR